MPHKKTQGMVVQSWLVLKDNLNFMLLYASICLSTASLAPPVGLLPSWMLPHGHKRAPAAPGIIFVIKAKRQKKLIVLVTSVPLIRSAKANLKIQIRKISYFQVKSMLSDFTSNICVRSWF